MHDLQGQRQVKKVENITSFIKEMKANLSDEAYSCFKTALVLYKKVSISQCLMLMSATDNVS